MKYRKIGSLHKDTKGSVLRNEQGNQYRVDEVMVVVWKMCDGMTPHDDIIKDLLTQTEMTEDEVKEGVMDIIARLERFGLIKRV